MSEVPWLLLVVLLLPAAPAAMAWQQQSQQQRGMGGHQCLLLMVVLLLLLLPAAAAAMPWQLQWPQPWGNTHHLQQELLLMAATAVLLQRLQLPHRTQLLCPLGCPCPQ
jgi:hypothetical protein